MRPARAVLAVFVASLACSSSGAVQQGTSSSLQGIDGAATVGGLDADQALQVCNWLGASYPGHPGGAVVHLADGSVSSPSSPSPSPGYVDGPGFGCTSPRLQWVWLQPSDCVANLRHSPCAATIAELEACVGYMAAHSSGPCPGAPSACTSFTGAAGCSETVFQSSADGCSGALPVESGAKCGAVDGG